MKTAFIFSGQGAQYAGMGKEFYENFSCAKDIFDLADETLGFSLKDICFNRESELNITENTQPAILTSSIAALQVIKQYGIECCCTAGLSLGEYSALVFADAIKFCDAVSLVKKRGKFMSEAVPTGVGSMYAIMGLDAAIVDECCQKASDLGYVSIANYNCPGQIAIAGIDAAVEKAAQLATESGAKLTAKLKVSGPFHTALLKPAAEKLGLELENININNMNLPVYTNVTGQILNSKSDIAPTLVKQVMSPVRFEDIIRNMSNNGVDTFIEIGPGKTLSGFVKRTLKGATILNIEDMKSLEKTLVKLNHVI